jgi:hypothetical protein
MRRRAAGYMVAPARGDVSFACGTLVALVQRVGDVPAGVRGFVLRVEKGTYGLRYEVQLEGGGSVWCIDQDLEPAMLSLVRGGA